MMFRTGFVPLAMAAMMAAAPVSAQEQQATPTVTAGEPSSIVKALGAAGYSATLETDDYGDPRITTDLSGREVSIWFYGCDEETRKNCDSLQLVIGFDADKPMTAQQMLDFMDKRRFASMTLDDEGDPWMSWDIVTGTEGIPQSVFLTAIRSFDDTIAAAENMIWPE